MTGKNTGLADLVQAGGDSDSAEEIAPGVYQSSGISNAYLLTTPEGKA